MARRGVVDYRLSHASSVLFLALIFVLIGVIAILGTLYVSGVLNVNNSVVHTFSISSASCNVSGTFIEITNNLNENVVVSEALLETANQSILLLPVRGNDVLSARGTAYFYSNSYYCPSFDTLSTVDVKVSFSSSSTVVYTFGPAYWDTLLTNSGTVTAATKDPK